MAQQTIEATDTLNEGRVKANENFDEIYAENAWTAVTPTLQANEITSASFRLRYNRIGRQVTCEITITGTGGSANTFVITNMPYAPVNSTWFTGLVQNNSVLAIGRALLTAGQTTLTIYPSATGAANTWQTNSGGKGIFMTITYEAES